ncbi:cysteine hydrolase family protein [Ferrigenium kumadai]|uniref:cysteine hydrolase family protein n=1 Tax=Ferrigenium kumadai TaxID=1682490 RepID=UPI001BB3F7F2|nr:cysteine hydrolase family protein [Ferrigenium kumadai]
MQTTALILVDVQKGFDAPQWGVRNNLDAEKNISLLLEKWRESGKQIIHIQHRSTEPDSPLRPDRPSFEFKPEAMPEPGEVVFRKNTNSAFIGTSLETYLREHGISSLVIVGFTTDHCVSTTTRMAGNLGYSVILVSDATATFDRNDINGVNIPAHEIQRIHLASLNREFCKVLITAEVLEDLERHVSNRG